MYIKGRKVKLITSKVFAFWSFSTILFALIAKVTFDSNVGDELTIKQWVSFISATFCVIILCLPVVISIVTIINKCVERILRKEKIY
ncbi:hypothetical protein ABD92_15160 [Lysinibacillus sphaericus]|nr:hypothetical protein AR327_23440 [Lysinibacillus sphaericus]AMR93119.1 hypothetical protein A1T07_23215 [Lysinibacillus sphaericus]MBG9710699.1 hypothetical protein [Lysinibacillus sphaericus]MBG9730392.1 hypothetical protein [Lysinibacillus sphaericus]MBG9739998.1 hypothetical protein [Lysinibacillus sphaericus]